MQVTITCLTKISQQVHCPLLIHNHFSVFHHFIDEREREMLPTSSQKGRNMNFVMHLSGSYGIYSGFQPNYSPDLPATLRFTFPSILQSNIYWCLKEAIQLVRSYDQCLKQPTVSLQ